MDPTLTGIGLLTQVLNAASLRHRVIAHNVANVNTPGFRRLEVTFEDDLARALAAPCGPSPPIRPRVIESLDSPERVDGNTVDIDREMGELSKNSLVYTAAIQILTSRLASLRGAVTGR